MAIIKPYKGIHPRIDPSAFIAENATIVGDVEIGPDANVWYGAVLRGDVGRIVVGARSNVQDGALVHMTTDLSHAILGEEVTVGHGAIIHGAIVEDGVLVGMGAILLDNSRIGRDSIVAAGALISAATVIPAGVLVMGQPGRVKRPLRDDELRSGRAGALHYVELGREHRVAAQ